MPIVVPKTVSIPSTDELFQGLVESLESVREFIGAAAGWVGLRDAAGELTFPVRGGEPPEGWLDLEQARGPVWGFATLEGPTLLNDLRPWAVLGAPPMRNLLCCPLGEGGEARGHVALANKPRGFASPDAAVLQSTAHFMNRLLARQQTMPRPSAELPAVCQHLLDRATEGIFIADESGVLVHVNAAWLEWTGFRAEDLLGQRTPYPFWVRHHDLGRAAGMAGAMPTSALPFRGRDQSLFWCQVEMVMEMWNGRRLTMAFLQRATPGVLASPEGGRVAVPPPASGDWPTLSTPAADWLILLLETGGGIDGWGPRWEKLTGLSTRDMRGSGTDLVLDWLFPHQTDRNRVADCLHQRRAAGWQAILDIATPAGSRALLCTFLPLSGVESSPEANAAPRRRWLLLAGESELLSAAGAGPLASVRADPSSEPHGPPSREGDQAPADL